MKFRRRQVEDTLELNLTPLIDCMLFIIIFLMMTTTFVKSGKLQISLPEATGDAQMATAAQAIEVSVSASGDYAVNGQALVSQQATALRSAIELLSEGKRNQTFIIAADSTATHQSVVTVMDIAGQMGFTNLSISTRQPEQK